MDGVKHEVIWTSQQTDGTDSSHRHAAACSFATGCTRLASGIVINQQATRNKTWPVGDKNLSTAQKDYSQHEMRAQATVHTCSLIVSQPMCR